MRYMQQPLKPLLKPKIMHCVSITSEDAPLRVSKTICIKLTGDGTNIELCTGAKFVGGFLLSISAKFGSFLLSFNYILDLSTAKSG